MIAGLIVSISRQSRQEKAISEQDGGERAVAAPPSGHPLNTYVATPRGRGGELAETATPVIQHAVLAENIARKPLVLHANNNPATIHIRRASGKVLILPNGNTTQSDFRDCRVDNLEITLHHRPQRRT